MIVQINDLAEDNLKDAPEWGSHPFSCKYCIYWEFPEECIDPQSESKDRMFRRKLDWLTTTKRSFGNCGKIAYVDDVAIGYAQYAPPKFLPNSQTYPAGPPSPDAVFISCLFIPDPRYRKMGLGSQILEEIIAELRQRGIAALETFARRGKQENPSGPAEFYLKHGFTVFHDDPEFPLLRLVL